MTNNKNKTVPNQRTIEVKKAPTDSNNLYATINLEALNEAAGILQTKAGYKLYIYLAKNTNNYKSALSSQHFCEWASVGIAAYNAAFNELKEQGYLIPKDKEKEKETQYYFYDKRQIKEKQNADIEAPKSKEKKIEKEVEYIKPVNLKAAAKLETVSADFIEISIEQAKEYWKDEEYSIDESGNVIFNSKSPNYQKKNIRIKK